MKIHILGASGSGTSTLGEALSKELKIKHFDTDYYFWHDYGTFTKKRETKERQALLMKDLKVYEDWVLTGSLCGWGDMFIPLFDLIVYLYVPQDIRMDRLRKREALRYGDRILPGGDRYEGYKAFMTWASKYDTGGIDMRSRRMHIHWLSNIEQPILRIEGDISVNERVEKVLVHLIQNL